LERNADHAAEAAVRLMPHKLELAPDFWRKRAEEARRLAELIEDNFTAEGLLDIALQYDELAERAERRRGGNRAASVKLMVIDGSGLRCGHMRSK
jgi:hypothetical protein